MALAYAFCSTSVGPSQGLLSPCPLPQERAMLWFQHPASLPEIACHSANTCLYTSLRGLRAMSHAGPSQGPREEEGC